MIGILAKIAKAAHLAKQAEAAIDVASNHLDGKKADEGGTADGEGVEEPKPAKVEQEPVDRTPAEYRKVLDVGARDARQLLTEEDAKRIIGKRIRSTIVAADDEFLFCDYGCKDLAETTLGLHIAAPSMSWDHFDAEIPKKEIFEGLGDAAFRGSRQIYVKSGDVVFWIHTAGETTIKMALDAARLVLQRLASGEG